MAVWIYDYHKFGLYHQNKIWAKLSHLDMAEYCNVSQEELVLALTDLQNNRVISLNDNECQVLDWEKLNLIINSPA